MFQVPVRLLSSAMSVTAGFWLHLKLISMHFFLLTIIGSGLIIGCLSANNLADAQESDNSLQASAGIPDAFRDEHRLWTSAEKSGSSDQYQNYLERFPEGVCSDLADKRVLEATAWEAVKGSLNARVIESYMSTNLSTKFAPTALDKLLEVYTGESSELGPNALVPSRVLRAIRELPPLVECETKEFLEHANVIAAVAAQAEEARIVENDRIAEEKRVAEEQRLAEERRVVEEARKAEAARVAEEQRIEEQRLAEERRVVEEARKAEAARVAEEKRVAEEQRFAEERRVVEEARKAEAARIAEEQRIHEERVAEKRRQTEAARIEEERRKEEQRLIEEKRRETERKTIVAEALVLVPLIEAYAKTGPDSVDLLRLVELFHKVAPILQGEWSEELHESYRELSAFVVKDKSFIVFQGEDKIRREAAQKAHLLSLQGEAAQAVSFLEELIVEEFSSPLAVKIVPVARALKEALRSNDSEVLERNLTSFRDFIRNEKISTTLNFLQEEEGEPRNSEIISDEQDLTVPENMELAPGSPIEKLVLGLSLTENEIITLLDTQKWDWMGGGLCLTNTDTYAVYSPTDGYNQSVDGRMLGPGEDIKTVRFVVDETKQSFVLEQHMDAIDWIGDAPSAKIIFTGELLKGGSLVLTIDSYMVDPDSTPGNVTYDRNEPEKTIHSACVLTEYPEVQVGTGDGDLVLIDLNGQQNIQGVTCDEVINEMMQKDTVGLITVYSKNGDQWKHEQFPSKICREKYSGSMSTLCVVTTQELKGSSSNTEADLYFVNNNCRVNHKLILVGEDTGVTLSFSGSCDYEPRSHRLHVCSAR